MPEILPADLMPLLRAAQAGRLLASTGLVSPVRPDRLVGMGLALAHWGLTPAAAYAAAAARCPDRAAIVDDRESVTFAEIHRRSNAIAHGLAGLGVRRREVVAILARNSAQFVLAQVAAAKLGADIVYLNTGFGAPQLAAVLREERVALVVADEEFHDVVTEAAPARPLVHAWREGERRPGAPLGLDDLARGDDTDPPPPGRAGRHVLLTSGTTGKPKGAARDLPASAAALEPFVALLSAIPLRARETAVVASPMFHAWGFAHLTFGQLLESTLVVTRRFDPQHTLALVEQHRADVLAAVPVMLQRMLAVSPEPRHDLSSLRVVALSGSALPVEVARRWAEAYGANLYDLYGSTEVAYASVATPQDLQAAPGSVGRPLAGVQVRIVDDGGRDVPPGETGRIFVGSALSFSGYTGGADKQRLDGLVASGDVGRIDADGRLWIEGRDDDMIVSGGENVFPGEVEELLRTHPAVADVAVVGVPDEEFGQRLVAHVVTRDRVTADALRAHVKASLANYKVPREIRFHDELPRNETGKVLKRVLRES